MANNLGTRLSAMTRADEIVDAVVDELHRAFGYYICHIVRLRAGGIVQSVVGRGEMYAQMGDARLDVRFVVLVGHWVVLAAEQDPDQPLVGHALE